MINEIDKSQLYNRYIFIGLAHRLMTRQLWSERPVQSPFESSG